jgi:hypothetical protein
MSYNVFDLCDDKGDYFEVDPAVMFPATFARIQEVLGGDAPVELLEDKTLPVPWLDPVVKNFYDQAKGFPGGAWDLAHIPLGNFAESTLGEDLTRATLESRAAVLGFAESWFKRALALAIGRGVRIHIARNPEYRRV